MAPEQDKQRPKEQQQQGGGKQKAGNKALPHKPGVTPGSVDVIGSVPEGAVRIDPDVTEGHPGYEESGDSEIIPPERLAGEERGKPGGGKS